MRQISRSSPGATAFASPWPQRAGAAAVLGGGLNVAIAFTGTMHNGYEGTAIFWVTVFVQALATGLMLGGLYGLHRRYGDAYGRLGRVVAALFGLGLAWLTVAMFAQGTTEAFGLEFSAPEESWFFVNLLSTVVATLYGVVLWRADVLGWGAAVMAATLPVAVAIVLVMDALVGDIGLAFWVPLGLAWLAVGAAMLRDRTVATGEPAGTTL